MSHQQAGCVYVDGTFTSPAQARFPALDHGVLYGDGLFETLRTYGGRPFRLDAHLERLRQGATLLGIRGGPEDGALRSALQETAQRAKATGLDELYLRITLTRGVGTRGLDPAGCETPTLMIAALPLRTYPAHLYEDGIALGRLWPRHARALPPPTVKSTAYQGAVLARAELNRQGVHEALYEDEAGHLTEGSVSNLFCVTGGLLLTPPATDCLPGITRAEVLSLAKERALPVEEKRLSLSDLRTADELFMTSSLAELLPVSRFEGVPVGSGRPGPLYRALHDAYRARCAGG